MLPLAVARNVMSNLGAIQTHLSAFNALSVSHQNLAVSSCMDLVRREPTFSNTSVVPNSVRIFAELIGGLRRDYPEYDVRVIQVVDDSSSLGVGFFFNQWGDASGEYWSLLILKDKIYADVPIKRADPTVGLAWAHDMDLSRARKELSSPL